MLVLRVYHQNHCSRSFALIDVKFVSRDTVSSRCISLHQSCICIITADRYEVVFCKRNLIDLPRFIDFVIELKFLMHCLIAFLESFCRIW